MTQLKRKDKLEERIPVVELNTATDTIHATSKNNRSILVKLHVVLCAIVRRVQVVGLRGELRSKSVDLLNSWNDTMLLAELADLDLAVKAGACLPKGGLVDAACDLTIGKPSLLGFTEIIARDGGWRLALQIRPNVVDSLKLLKEPAIDVGKIVELINTHSTLESRSDRMRPLRVGANEEVTKSCIVVVFGLEALVACIDHAQGLLERLLKRSTNSHNLTDTFHLASKSSISKSEFSIVPSGNLGDNIVKAWLKTSLCALRHSVVEVR